MRSIYILSFWFFARSYVSIHMRAFYVYIIIQIERMHTYLMSVFCFFPFNFYFTGLPPAQISIIFLYISTTIQHNNKTVPICFFLSMILQSHFFWIKLGWWVNSAISSSNGTLRDARGELRDKNRQQNSQTPVCMCVRACGGEMEKRG